MAATTKNELITARNPRDLMHLNVKSDQNLYQGTLVYAEAAGGGAVADDAAGANPFLGVVKHQRDRAGGDLRDVEYYRRGIFTLPQNGSLAAAQLGASVHGIDNFTVAASGGVVVGTLLRVISSSLVEVDLNI